MKTVLVVVGARPNFIKIARFRQVAANRGRLAVRIVHTGQHFSPGMADVFFDQFGMRPDRHLGIGAGSPIAQISGIMSRMESVITDERPALVMVVGDVNTALAAAVAANKMDVPLGHLESGLRSFDRGMPEEHNRVAIDHLADIHFITEQSGVDNLRAEGLRPDSLHFVGNTMIDTLVAFGPQVKAATILEDLGIAGGGHALMTLHRPATVDVPERLSDVLDLAEDIVRKRRVVFPLHPRTSARLAACGLMARAESIPGLICTGPLDYCAFQKLLATAAYILTDSGGVQEESTYRRVPCLTLRPNTERPVTVAIGTNELVPNDMPSVRAAIARIEAGTFKKGEIPALWDGHATDRIFEVLEQTI